jgi:hypothetical protein
VLEQPGAAQERPAGRGAVLVVDKQSGMDGVHQAREAGGVGVDRAAAPALGRGQERDRVPFAPH